MTTDPRTCRCRQPILAFDEDGDQVCYRCGRPVASPPTRTEYELRAAEQLERDRETFRADPTWSPTPRPRLGPRRAP